MPQTRRDSFPFKMVQPSHIWASLVSQLVKNLPAMQETWVSSLGRSPGEGKGYPLQCSGLENSVDCIGVAKGPTRLSNFRFDFQSCLFLEIQYLDHGQNQVTVILPIPTLCQLSVCFLLGKVRVISL